VKSGYGVYSYKDGSKYEGQWKNDKKHGDGYGIDASGNRKKEKWNNGKAA
jgi:hypothetical protein